MREWYFDTVFQQWKIKFFFQRVRQFNTWVGNYSYEQPFFRPNETGFASEGCQPSIQAKTPTRKWLWHSLIFWLNFADILDCLAVFCVINCRHIFDCLLLFTFIKTSTHNQDWHYYLICKDQLIQSIRHKNA